MKEGHPHPNTDEYAQPPEANEKETSQTVYGLINEFKSTLREVPEFRQTLVKQGLDNPPPIEIPELTNALLESYLSEDPQRRTHAFDKDRFENGISFETAEFTYSINYSPLQPEGQEETWLCMSIDKRRKDDPEVNDWIILQVAKTANGELQSGVSHYQKNERFRIQNMSVVAPKIISSSPEDAIPGARDVLSSLK